MTNAFNLGREYAEHALAYGATEPLDAPLSGEWADGPTLGDLASALEIHHDAPDAAEWINEAADEWEAGYYSAPWPSRIEA